MTNIIIGVYELFDFSKMKNAFILIIIFLIAAVSFGQETESLITHAEYSPRKNSFYLEIAGDGALFSLNYDRLLLFKNKHSLIGRAGFGFLFNIVLVEATYALGKKTLLRTWGKLWL